MTKPRKRYSEKINDKDRSKRKLIDAVGEVIRTKGYTGLNSTNIANAAGMSRRTISMYFGDVDNLIEIYINGKDYCIGIVDETKDLSSEASDTSKGMMSSSSLLQHLPRQHLDITSYQSILASVNEVRMHLFW